ncbi:50S ribosomal protein L21 [bacterium]|nr:50S ribosomal protein L21 [bacterium]
MYAIAKIGGMQFKTEKGKNIEVPYMPHKKVGDKVELKDILFIKDGDSSFVGKPNVQKAKVVAEITSHKKGEKIIVFKKKRRKGYSVKNGHRQMLTEITILDIVSPKSSASKKSQVKKEEEIKEVEVQEESSIEEQNSNEEVEEQEGTDENAESSKDE